MGMRIAVWCMVVGLLGLGYAASLNMVDEVMPMPERHCAVVVHGEPATAFNTWVGTQHATNVDYADHTWYADGQVIGYSDTEDSDIYMYEDCVG